MKKIILSCSIFMCASMPFSYAVMPPSTSIEESAPQKKDVKEDIKKVEDRLESDLGELKSLTLRLSDKGYSHGD